MNVIKTKETVKAELLLNTHPWQLARHCLAEASAPTMLQTLSTLRSSTRCHMAPYSLSMVTLASPLGSLSPL